MFCPNCGSEYKPGVTECMECEVALVETLPEPADEPEFVPLREITDPDEMPVVRSVLEAAGIPFVLQGEETQGLFPLPDLGASMAPPALGAIVHVPKDRLEEARDLLDTVAVPSEPLPDSPED